MQSLSSVSIDYPTEAKLLKSLPDPLPRHHLALFARFPYPGQCKTRLIPRIGEDGACSFARAALVDILHNFAGLACSRKTLFFTPATARPDILQLLEEESLFSLWDIQPQVDSPNLGDRLFKGFEHIKRFRNDIFLAGQILPKPTATFIGMDCFDLTCGTIEDSMSLVSSTQDRAHMIPADDGGYALLTIPLTCDSRSIFDNVPWSCSQTGSVQKKRLEEAGLSCMMDKPCFDVDTPNDLERLWKLRHGKHGDYPRVFGYLETVM